MLIVTNVINKIIKMKNHYYLTQHNNADNDGNNFPSYL